MKSLITILIAFFIFSCTEDNIDTKECTTSATIRDLTNLAGCGFVFELNDGTRLQPYRIAICGTGPLPEEITNDPLYNFKFVDGKKVLIGYESTKAKSYTSCMAGTVVKITCISEVGTSSTD